MILKVILSLCVVCFITTGAAWLSGDAASADNGGKKKMRDPIEEKARKAKDNNEAAIRELADALFSDVAPAIPAVIGDGMKDRLVRAEVKFRQGKRGIRETHIVRTVNKLADTFGAPAYARTSPLQVRTLRVELMKSYPSFIAQDEPAHKGLKKGVGEPMNPEVSPLEAFYIAAVMIEQKMLNEDWQEEPTQWAAHAKLHKRHFITAGTGGPQLLVNPPNSDKRREMAGVVNRGLANMNLEAGQQLAATTLDALGIEK